MTNHQENEENTLLTAMKTRPRCKYPYCWHKSTKCGFCKSHVDEGLVVEALIELKSSF